MKNIFHIVYLAIIVLLMLFGGCQYFKKNIECPEITGTVTTIDTIKGSVDSYKPIPVSPNVFHPSGKVPRETVRKTSPARSDVKIQPADPGDFTVDAETGPDPTAGSTEKVDPINYYKDSMEIKKKGDTAVLGKVYLDEMVKGNEIIDRQWSYVLFQKTTTNNVETKKRNRWFFGIQGLGNQVTPVRWIGGSIAVMPKKANSIYLIGAGPMDGKVYYHAGAYIKIGKR